MMSLSLDFVWDFLKPVLSDTLKNQLEKSGEKQAKDDLLSLNKVLVIIEQSTDLFVGAIGEIVAFERDKLAKEGQEKLRNAQKYSKELLNHLLELAHIMERIAPKMSVYKYELIQEIQSYRSSRALVISKLEEEIFKIEYGDYKSSVINDLYLKSLENLKKIKAASAEIRQFIATQFDFKDLY